MSVERYAHSRKVELGRSLLKRRKVYLDARFWIILRDTASGARAGSNDRKLLHHLQRGVRSGQLVCPISTDMLMKLEKQPKTPGRRQATAEVIDELSMGVSAIDPRTLLGTEVHRLLLEARGGFDLHPMQELIWTKAAYALGDVYPILSGIDNELQVHIPKDFYDHLWRRPVVEIAQTMSDDPQERRDMARLTAETNENNSRHRDDLRSFGDAYDTELRGIVEVAGEIAADVAAELANREAGGKLTPTVDERASSVNMCRNLLYHAMLKSEYRTKLRTIHIGASIHAGMRWDKDRKFKVNDWHDFGHAGIALGYCDAFLTEKSLHHLVTRPQLDLEKINGCRVASNIRDAVDIVRSLTRYQDDVGLG